MKLYTKQDIMKMLNIGDRPFRRYVKDGTLPARQLDGRAYVFTEDDIKAFLNNIKIKKN